ncbi:hypothetical protein [Ramlibacter humi]|uniref:Uncharacterized protein n=1 Tax=Ramlibacter humi TaxID=2530451 RepID=A0A4Z0CBF9_9BURK|nr:hypothetical protein [Ramlibacter humi]TFZ07700.1 hypothetical protein EZ216_00610 [Ramlibacter humi]
MTHGLLLRRRLLEAVALAIRVKFPQAHVDPVRHDSETGIYSVSIVLRNGIELALADYADGVDTSFFVMRASEEMPFRLAFEGAYEDGCGVTDSLTPEMVLDLLEAYEGVSVSDLAPH